ncbi:MAG: SDR family NAD(P)-dependent oxidoreductase [Chitinophagales bacterium]
MKLLENKVGIITGAGSGIGKSIALRYAEEGARLVLSDIDDHGGNETESLIKSKGGIAFFIHADTSKPDDSRKTVELALREFGRLDLSVNNAGIGGPLKPVGEYPIEGWDEVISVNLSGVFYGMRYQIPAILESGGGTIVNISSILGKVATRNAPAYTASKHGIVGLTECAALEYADRNIRINSVGPGYILTPLLTKNLDEASISSIANMHPMGRLGTSEEVAELVLWLNSGKSSFVTGAYYPVDGGYLAQ